MVFFKRKSRKQEEEGAEPPPAGEAVSRDFFELEPEEVVTWKPPSPALVSRSRRNLKAAAAAMAAAVLLGGLITALVLLWPSSNVRVPGLAGKILGEAMETARHSGLKPEVEGWAYSGKHSDGVVLSQNPPGRTIVVKGSKVSLTVSKGPRPEGGDLTGRQAGQTDSGNTAANFYAGKTICIDPGHQVTASQGEWVDPGMNRRSPPDDGSRGVATGNPEYLLTMDIAAKLRGLLEKDGINVVMTRESGGVDLTNINRAEIANNRNAVLLVSVHLNESRDMNTRGTNTLYPANTTWTAQFYEKSKTAALYIQEETVGSCGTEDLGITARDDLALFNWSRVPVAEVLVAYLSNPDEEKLLATDDFRWKAAWGIRDGIIKYLRNP